MNVEMVETHANILGFPTNMSISSAPESAEAACGMHTVLVAGSHARGMDRASFKGRGQAYLI
jgi:hypothetical protein